LLDGYLARAAAFKVSGFLKQQGCHEGDDRRGSGQQEGVAEGEDKGLLLHDMTDRDRRALRRVDAVDFGFRIQ
jgi:hypothetical protein